MPRQRFGVSMLLTPRDGRPDIMVIDAKDRPVARKSELVGRALDRDEVIGTPLAQDVFAFIDEVFLQDPRAPDMLSDGARPP
jgi:hypothetical protein